MENDIIVYEPTFIEDENGKKWLLQDPNTTRFFAGEIIGFINNDNNITFIILTGMPYERNISYDTIKKDDTTKEDDITNEDDTTKKDYGDNKLIKYNYNENEFTDDVRAEDLSQIIGLTDDIVNRIKATRKDKSKPIQYKYERNHNNKTDKNKQL